MSIQSKLYIDPKRKEKKLNERGTSPNYWRTVLAKQTEVQNTSSGLGEDLQFVKPSDVFIWKLHDCHMQLSSSNTPAWQHMRAESEKLNKKTRKAAEASTSNCIILHPSQNKYHSRFPRNKILLTLIKYI